MKKCIIISGAAGLIGTGLLGLLKNRHEYEITALDKNKPAIEGRNIVYLKKDLTLKKTWDGIKKKNVYAFIHCAAMIPRTFSGKKSKRCRRINSIIDDFALSFAKESNKYEIYNITSGYSISMKELAFLVKRITKSKSEVKAAGTEDLQELCRPDFDISEAKKALGWKPVFPIRKGIREFVNYIKDNEL